MSRKGRCGAKLELAYGDGITAECYLPRGHGGPHVSDGSKALTVWSAPTQDEQDQRDDGEDDQNRPQHGGGDTRIFEPVHGRVTRSGGGEFSVMVDRDTHSYPAGRVVTRPETIFNAGVFGDDIPAIDDYRPLSRNRVELTDEPAIALDGTTYRIVTPEIQAVLDALPAYIHWRRIRRSEPTPLYDSEYAFESAADAYLASIKPPKPTALSCEMRGTTAVFAMSDGTEIHVDISDPYSPRIIG